VRRGRSSSKQGFSWAPNDDEALEGARVWKGAVPDEFYVDDWFDPQAMYEEGERQVSDEDFKAQNIVSSDPDEHVERIKQIEALADGDVIVKLSNQSGSTALEAIRVYGEQVLPKLRSCPCLAPRGLVLQHRLFLAPGKKQDLRDPAAPR
jgi:coenzyme F420-dependent glucose-6-phosphate dehydrogenase